MLKIIRYSYSKVKSFFLHEDMAQSDRAYTRPMPNLWRIAFGFPRYLRAEISAARLLLFGFALNTHCSMRNRFQTFFADLFTTNATFTKCALCDSIKSFLYMM